MKEFFIVSAALLSSYLLSAQTTADFENLTVPASGFYNGSDDHSGNLSQTETFTYQSGIFEFSVSYTPEDGYDYWSGMAYTNQTDLETADWTTYSAYANAPDGGGADNSANYGTAYLFGSLSFSFSEGNENSQISGAYFSNHAWTYHYMNGTDGSASPYTAGDYFKLIISDELENSAEFYLADFTNGNAYIIDDWTFVDLSALTGNNFSISYESSDDWTPGYFCIDNITAEAPTTIASQSSNVLTVYPNPARDYIFPNGIKDNETIRISDISGRTLKTVRYTEAQAVSISDLQAGVYILTVLESGKSQKFIKK